MMVLGQKKAVHWLVIGGTESVWGVAGWYLVVLGQYLALLGIKWYWVSIGLLCLYLLRKNGDLVECHHSGTTNSNNQGKIELLSQWTIGG